MPYAIPRYMASRVCKVGETSTLMVQAIPKGATIGKINGVVRVVSTLDVNGATSLPTPFGTVEYNLFALYVPYDVAATYTETVDSKPGVPDNVQDWDNLTERLILNYGLVGGSEYFGANPDGAAGQLDLRKSPAQKSGDTDSNTETNDALVNTEIGLGPMGVRRFFNFERFITSTTPLNISKTITTPGSIPSTSLNDLLYSDNIDLDQTIGASGPGFFILGVQRFKVAASRGYACSFSKENTNDVVSDADRRRALNILFTGDMLRVKSMLSDPTSQVGDYIRTLLWYGDVSLNPVSASNNSILGQMWPDGESTVRANDIVVSCKYACPMSVPYEIQPDLM